MNSTLVPSSVLLEQQAHCCCQPLYCCCSTYPWPLLFSDSLSLPSFLCCKCSYCCPRCQSLRTLSHQTARFCVCRSANHPRCPRPSNKLLHFKEFFLQFPDCTHFTCLCWGWCASFSHEVLIPIEHRDSHRLTCSG